MTLLTEESPAVMVIHEGNSDIPDIHWATGEESQRAVRTHGHSGIEPRSFHALASALGLPFVNLDERPIR